MMRRIILVAVLATTLTLAFTAGVAHTAVPHPDMVCGYCDGSGYNGCNQVSDWQADGWNDYTGSNISWCWSNGSITEYSGWASEADTWWTDTCFAGYASDHDFYYNSNMIGHDVVSHFAYCDASWLVKSTSHRCIWVDGWGNYGICRGWNE